MMKGKTHSFIEIAWIPPPCHRAAIIHYTVKMNDITVYVGPEIVFKSRDLRCVLDARSPCSAPPPCRAKHQYEYVVAATNSCGQSMWSHPRTFETSPGPPAPPEGPSLVEASQHWLRVKWPMPWDGGSPVTKFVLYVNERIRYEGLEQEVTVDKMVEATAYRFRVNAINDYGVGEFSQESRHITIEGPPDIPTALEINDQTFDSVVLIWKAASRIGAAIDYFEVEVDGVIEYTGKEQRHFKGGLGPFEAYEFVVFAVNKYGRSPASDKLKLVTGTAPPEIPMGLRCVHCTSRHLAVEWRVPKDNGEYIQNYILHMNGTQVTCMASHHMGQNASVTCMALPARTCQVMPCAIPGTYPIPCHAIGTLLRSPAPSDAPEAALHSSLVPTSQLHPNAGV